MEEQERRNVNCRRNTGYQQLVLKAARDDVFNVNRSYRGLRLKGRSSLIYTYQKRSFNCHIICSSEVVTVMKKTVWSFCTEVMVMQNKLFLSNYLETSRFGMGSFN